MVSGGSLKESESRWISLLRYSKNALMHMWRFAVITYLREALEAGMFASDFDTNGLKAILKEQYERWWNINIAHFRSKWQFLRYAGRYALRPPIAQHRFLKITDQEVEFWTKDLRQKRAVITRYPREKFIQALAEHVLDHYRHAIRHFGLLALRSKAHTSPAIFSLLGQQKRSRPRRLSWAAAVY